MSRLGFVVQSVVLIGGMLFIGQLALKSSAPNINEVKKEYANRGQTTRVNEIHEINKEALKSIFGSKYKEPEQEEQERNEQKKKLK